MKALAKEYDFNYLMLCDVRKSEKCVWTTYFLENLFYMVTLQETQCFSFVN